MADINLNEPAPKKKGGKRKGGATTAIAKTAKRAARKYGGTVQSVGKPLVMGGEFLGGAALASFIRAKYPTATTFMEKADKPDSGIDARWLVGGLATAAVMKWAPAGSTLRTHSLPILAGVLASWASDRGRAWGEDSLEKAEARKADAAIARNADGSIDRDGDPANSLGIGEIDPETGAIRGSRRLATLQTRIDRLKTRREKILNRSGIDTPVGGRQANAQRFVRPRAAAQRARQIPQQGLVSVPAWAVKPAYAAQFAGVEDEDMVP